MTNAELIVQTLRRAGITHGFGIPSGNVLPLLDAMRTGGLPFVLTAHEGSAAFAADVMGRLTGAPGLCIATLGPGATNLTTGVGDAFLDRSPLLAITCNVPTAQLGRRIQMAIDHHALFRPLTKASLALRPGRVAAALAEALEIALSEPCGPVHLDLPEDVATATATERVPGIPAGRALRPPAEAALLLGDGCFQMTCGEVAVARRLGLPLPFVVLDDGWLSLIQVKQQRRRLGIYGTEVGRAAGDPPAHYFGVPVVPARTPEALAKALRDALDTDHPTVIEVAVDPAHYAETVYD